MTDQPRNQQIQVRFVPVSGDKPQEEVYANVINVSHTPWDFTLRFCCASMPNENEIDQAKAKDGKMELPAPQVAAIKVSPRVANEIVEVLQSQIRAHKANFESTEE